MEELQKAAKTLESSIVATTPRPNPLLLTVTPDQLATASQIQLVSYDNQPNETATVGAARNTNSDLMLQANVVFAHLTPIVEKRRSFLRKLLKRKREEMHLTVHWTVVDVSSGQRVLEQTIDTTESDVKRVSKAAGDQLQMENSSIVSLAAYRGWQLVSPQLKLRKCCWICLGFGSGPLRYAKGTVTPDRDVGIWRKKNGRAQQTNILPMQRLGTI